MRLAQPAAGASSNSRCSRSIDAVREALKARAHLSARRGRGQCVAGAFDAGRSRHLAAARGGFEPTAKSRSSVLHAGASTLDIAHRLAGRQRRAAHEIRVDAARAAPAVGDRPDDQRLAALHVAGCEDAGDVRHPVRVAGDGAALGQRDPQLARSGRCARGRRIPSRAARGRRRTRSVAFGVDARVACRRATRPSAVPENRSVAIA